MSSGCRVLEKALGSALSGRGSHAGTSQVFAALPWKIVSARPGGVPHSIFQLLNHMSYWQDWAAGWLDGQDPPLPRHASGSWPGSPGPASQAEWRRAVDRFRAGLDALERQTREQDLFRKRGRKSRLEMLQAIASHNSYHAGQVVVLRQALGTWPPPSGSLTW